MQADAERLYHELRSGGDQTGAERATLELAKLRFFAGHAASGLELAQELLPTVSRHSRIRDELLGWIAAFAYWGPMPVPEALVLMDELAPQIRASWWAANRVARVHGALLAEQGRFDDARAELEAAERTASELGVGYVISALRGHFMGPVELMAGNPQRAVELELIAYEWMTETGFVGFANTVAAHLARAMLELGRIEEAEQWATTVRELTTETDPAATGPALGVAARVRARRGDFKQAERLGREAVASFDGTDFLDMRADAHADLADVLRLAGRQDDEEEEVRRALALYDQKGHVVGANRMRERLAELEGPRAG
jgi:tetratricopeptide (TPR) repeat protein